MDSNTNGIAIIGMSGRFPGAPNVNVFWENLCAGKESISFFSDNEMLKAGIAPSVLKDPRLVKAGGILEDIDLFDAYFFDYSPREAESIDHQQRIFLECAWEALEASGYVSENYNGAIGVYASVGANTYLLQKDLSNSVARKGMPRIQLSIGNEKDFMAPRVSYKLNLRGPSVNIQTTCSSSLVAVHLACQSLLNGECDVALAGGVSISAFQKEGYFYEEGGISSHDGHCRAFDASASGTLPGNGVGVVVLKPLADAIAERDFIYAVIKGSAINNDGSHKVGFTAPSVEGQARVITEALAVAEFHPETIGYIEAHGTGTSLGDPIEIAALTKAFRANTQAKSFCALGSVKTNLGHLDTAAGMAGLIKTALALKHKFIPASLHFERPNPQIDFANSPFYVNTTTSSWEAGEHPRRAGVSSYGFGGTNAHVVLEEAPVVATPEQPHLWHLIVLSAKTRTALKVAAANLSVYLAQHPKLSIADVAFTLQNGRKSFDHRRMLVCQSLNDAAKMLETSEDTRAFTAVRKQHNMPIVFLFPGQGSQYVGMGQELYQTEPTFRRHVDRCSEYLIKLLGFDLRAILYNQDVSSDDAAHHLKQTLITQPALFVTEYALAKLWMEWGIYPHAMIGHSLGEYVAACLAEVFSLEDALTLVAMRGKLMQQLSPGAMLVVPFTEHEVAPFLKDGLCLAAINHPSSSVISGPIEAVENLQKWLVEQGREGILLRTSHAFHSSMMDTIVETFKTQFKGVDLKAPKIPYISNITATWVTEQEATNPDYWAQHLRKTVYFAQGVFELLKTPDQILLEVGPGQTLNRTVKQIISQGLSADEPGPTSSKSLGTLSSESRETLVFSSLSDVRKHLSDVAFLLDTLGKLWLVGVRVDWTKLYTTEQRRHIPLPTYPFERQRYWLTTTERGTNPDQQPEERKLKADTSFYIPSWKRSMPPRIFQAGEIALQERCWLVLIDSYGLGAQIVKQLEQEYQYVVSVTAGGGYKKLDDCTFILDPRNSNDYDLLLRDLRSQDKLPQIVVHLWSFDAPNRRKSGVNRFEKFQEGGYYSMLYLIHALEKNECIRQFELGHPLQIEIITNGIMEVTYDDIVYPEKTTVMGLCMVVQQEYPGATCHCIDITFSQLRTTPEAKLVAQLLSEIIAKPTDMYIAYRGNQRWIKTFQPVHLDQQTEISRQLRKGGVYLITGGLGGVGLLLAKYLSQRFQAKLVLLGRTSVPQNDEERKARLTNHSDQDEVSRKLRKIQELEDLGSEVLLVQGDVGNEEQMSSIITQIYERFGTIHGVIHAAATTRGDSISPIKNIDEAASNAQFRPKVYGAYVLRKVLQGKELDFCVFLSSNAAILGGLQLGAYAAANLFLDAFANQQSKTSEVPWISTNWDGLLVDEQVASMWEEEREGSAANVDAYMLTPEEITRAFEQVVTKATLGQVIISASDMLTRLNIWSKGYTLSDKEVANDNDVILYERPELRNDYVPPRNEIEEQVTSIWQNVLGIEKVGVYDNFFLLGGHSLSAMQLVTQVRERFQTTLPLKSFFETPTIEGMVQLIKRKV